MEERTRDWSRDVYEVMGAEGIRYVATVPDGGLTRLLQRCQADEAKRVVTLTTEEEGVAFLAGAWLGGERGALLMQSSGVGNCINMLSLPRVCRIPCVLLITMRGVWGEFNPWQVPMGRAVRPALEAMNVVVYEPDGADDVGDAFRAASRHAHHTGSTAAVLIGQRIVGSKDFERREADG
ncbi:MAG: phosphonopyruvate decarboxylase [Gemmatimonadetes bacterium]|nr:phosphonopyruvate decarboxylase [Gemmatimonadota bacterium]